jgi:hypothetical protein
VLVNTIPVASVIIVFFRFLSPSHFISLSISLGLSLQFFYRCEWVKKLGTEGTKSFLKILSIGFGKHSRDTYSLCVEIFYCSFIYNCFESFTGWVVAYIITPSPLSQYPDDQYHEKRNRKVKKNRIRDITAYKHTLEIKISFYYFISLKSN